MHARVLVLRRGGVLVGHHVDRYCTGTEQHQTPVLMDMQTGGSLVIRSVMSAPGTGKLGELYQPHLVYVTDLGFRSVASRSMTAPASCRNGLVRIPLSMTA